MDDARFWSMVEDAWRAAGGKAKTRQKLAAGTLAEDKAADLQEAMDDAVVPALEAQLRLLPADELLAFDRILERKLYDLDRAEVHERTDGSDDGFLYARGFIVAAGRGYYDAVNAVPSVALEGLECEAMCYLSTHVYREKFGEPPASGICRETGSNAAGGHDLAK